MFVFTQKFNGTEYIKLKMSEIDGNEFYSKTMGKWFK